MYFPFLPTKYRKAASLSVSFIRLYRPSTDNDFVTVFCRPKCVMYVYSLIYLYVVSLCARVSNAAVEVIRQIGHFVSLLVPLSLLCLLNATQEMDRR